MNVLFVAYMHEDHWTVIIYNVHVKLNCFVSATVCNLSDATVNINITLSFVIIYNVYILYFSLFLKYVFNAAIVY